MNTTDPNSPATLADAPAVMQGTPPCPFCHGATIPVPCVPNPMRPAIPGFRCDNPTCGMCGHHMPLPVAQNAQNAQPVKAAHTPGPLKVWFHGGNNGHGLYVHKLSNGIEIHQHLLGSTVGQIEANVARIVESWNVAPDLLAALEAVTGELESVWRSDGMRNPNSYAVTGRAAIAKAKGAK